MLAVRNRAIDGAGLSPTRFAALPAATGAFTSRLSARRSPFPPLDITTAVTGPPLLTGLAPAGMTTSLAARSPRYPGDPSRAFASVYDPDVLRGDPAAMKMLKNKKVIIGATAIELGD